jgi:DNA processing protein
VNTCPAQAYDADDVAVAALAGLPYLRWDQLTRLLDGRTPVQAWRAVHGGAAGAALARAAAPVSLADVAARHQARGVAIRRLGTTAYPAVLAADHEPPPALFTWGSLDTALDPDHPRVSIVGTRRCTNYGRDVARQLGRELSAAGVSVVSGLAAGIDGAAHDGALAAAGAPPVGVVGSGLDVIYPRQHAALWDRVAQTGALLSEAPLGCAPEPWRFPARNRILAAAADVLVVVESHTAGGSMHTVRAAEERGVPVLAVPGPIRSRASSGTNLLLSQGCHPVCDVADVLTALSLCRPGPMRPASPGPVEAESRTAPPADVAAVLEAVDWTATSLDTVLARTDASPGRVSAALAWLAREGWVHGMAGWWERC